MSFRTLLTQFVKAVAEELADGSFGEQAGGAVAWLEEHPESTLDLLELLVKEASRKKPKPELLEACFFLLGQGLEFLRYRMESGRKDGEALVLELQEHLVLQAPHLPSLVILRILQEFTRAKLLIVEALRQQFTEMLDEQLEEVAHAPHFSGIAEDEAFKSIYREMGCDPFAFQAQIVEQTDPFPTRYRAVLAASFLGMDEPGLREAALGWLLDRDGEVRHFVTQALEQASGQGRMTSTLLRRMIAMRNWLPEKDRPALDAAIRTARLKGIDCAPWPEAVVVSVHVSGEDGAGAQSLFVVGKEGRQFCFGALLLKRGFGVRDAWVRHDLTRQDIRDLLGQIGGQTELFKTSADYMRLLIGQNLAQGARENSLPPFALLEFAEAAGLPDLRPAFLETADVLEALHPAAELQAETEPAPAMSEKQVCAVLRRCGSEEKGPSFLAYWFEDDPEVGKVLGRRVIALEKAAEAVRDRLLQPRREAWADKVAWAALMLKHAGKPKWAADFALVARELLGERPCCDFLMLDLIALRTVMSHLHQRRSGRGRLSAGGEKTSQRKKTS